MSRPRESRPADGRYRPDAPYFCVGVQELRFISKQGGTGQDILVWIGLLRLSNSRCSVRFQATVTEVADLADLRYRRCHTGLRFLARIGLLKATRARPYAPCVYELLKPAGGPAWAAITSAAAFGADAATARPADRREQAKQTKVNREAKIAGKIVRDLALPGARPTTPHTHQTENTTLQAKEPSALPDYAAAYDGYLEGKPFQHVLAFVATGHRFHRITKAIQSLAGALPEADVRRICREVYLLGNSSTPPWDSGKRAAVLTNRLRECTGCDADSSAPVAAGTQAMQLPIHGHEHSNGCEYIPIANDAPKRGVAGP